MTDLDDYLLDEGEFMDARDIAFMKAVAAGDLPLVKSLGAATGKLLPHSDYPLRLAAWHGHLAVVQYLLEAGADPTSFLGETALAEAAENGHIEIAKILVAAGTDVSALNDLALRKAVASGHVEIVKLLRNAGAKSYSPGSASGRRSSFEVLVLAAEKGHLAIVQFLLSTGEVSPAEQKKAIRLAAAKGHVAVVQHLLTAGDAREIDTHLLRAAGGSPAVLRCLIDAGANIKRLQLVVSDLPPDMQKLVVSTGKPWKESAAKYASTGICTAALYIILQRQGKAELATLLKATRMLEPLTPAARAEMLGGLLVKQTHPESSPASP